MKQYITFENWPKDWESVPVGVEVSEEVYNYFFNVLPPIRLSRDKLVGFQMSEPHDLKKDDKGCWKDRYLTFARVEKRYFYVGLNFAGRCPYDVSDLDMRPVAA